MTFLRSTNKIGHTVKPDVLQEWSDEDVARRWWQLFPKRRNADGSPATPQSHELGMLTVGEDALAERHRRLGDLS